jgi:hypothetical protein
MGSSLNRTKAIFLLVTIVVFAVAFAAFKFWPKKYKVVTRMPEAIAFWNDREAFVFLSLNTSGQAQNEFQEKLAGTRYGYLSAFLGSYIDFQKQDVVGYHLSADGQLDRFPLADRSALYGAWSLVDGRLQLTPPSFTSEINGVQQTVGFRWDGEKFISVSAPPRSATSTAPTKLTADDESDDDDDGGFLNKTARQEFKAAGWHYKMLMGYTSGAAQATLPIPLAGSLFSLTLETTPATDLAGKFDYFTSGPKSIRLSGEKLGTAPRVLWNQPGWRTMTKAEYEALKLKYGRPRNQRPFAWTWLVVLVVLLVWKFAAWFHLIFSFGTMKGRVLKNMATTFSFPPATPAQFPALDVEALDRYSRELEGMGFTRLLDFSLVSDSPTHPPSFCRLLAHQRHHCFATITQMFPRGKKPLPLRLGLEGCLQNGWSLGFSNMKPLATSSLVRRRKALGVSMPDASGSELLQAFLKMREQVCLDLGVSPVNDDTLEAFINKTQRSAAELREAVQERNFVKGLPEVYLRKFSLLKTKPEYVWLGDYPKEADRRKQGLSSFAAVTR